MDNLGHIKVVRNFDDRILKKGMAVAFGSFDGVHTGHQKVLNRAHEIAKKEALIPAVFVFWPHPRFILKPTLPFIISGFRDQIESFKKSGIEVGIINRFNEVIRDMDYNSFIKEYILKNINMKYAIVGYDYTFGKNAQGDIEKLKILGKLYGFKVAVVPPVMVDGEIVSSSKIRRYLMSGNMEKAGRMLGRHYSVTSRVKKGNRRGSKIGIPTINLYPKIGLPADGVYCGNASIKDKVYKAAINIGTNPTFGDSRHIEAHLINFSGDLESKVVKLELIRYIRGEIRFNNTNELITRIKEDIKECR
ncbi:MAG: riboflavin biosynthesis protein [bacterium]|nr:MAG: riboflavin biosynthesis protein [bacterium]